MNRSSFVEALIPIWLIEVFVSIFLMATDGRMADSAAIVFQIIGCALLPLGAGFRVVSAQGNVALAVAGGASISIISILVVGAGFLIMSPGVLSILGYIMATLMFTVIPQCFFGFIGGVTTKVLMRAT